jgi:hypothetical protein
LPLCGSHRQLKVRVCWTARLPACRSSRPGIRLKVTNGRSVGRPLVRASCSEYVLRMRKPFVGTDMARWRNWSSRCGDRVVSSDVKGQLLKLSSIA